MRRRQGTSPRFSPHLAHLAPSIRWLRQHDVSPQTLSGAFATTPAHIRLLDHRASRAPALDDAPLPAAVRPEEDTIIISSARQAVLDALADRIDTIFEEHARGYTFTDGMVALARLLPPTGYPASVPLIRLKARVLRHQAWFASHCGRSRTAIRSARASMQMYRRAYAQTGARDDLQAVADAALIGANGYLLCQEPARALHLLVVVDRIADRLRAPHGSEYHRQRAVAMFQLGHDDVALAHLDVTYQVMHRQGRLAVHTALAVDMRRNVFRDGDAAHGIQIVRDVSAHFGTESLEAAMARNWAAACAVGDGRDADVHDLLVGEGSSPDRYGHQATISYLLALTPALSLRPAARAAWARYALYVNVFCRT